MLARRVYSRLGWSNAAEPKRTHETVVRGQEWLDWLRYLTASAELSHLLSMTNRPFYQHLMDVA
jgi:hypothetical protein